MSFHPFLARAACTLWLAASGLGGAAMAADRPGRVVEKPLDLAVRHDAGAWTGVRDKAPVTEPTQAALRLRERERERAGAASHGQPYGAGYEARVMRGDGAAASATGGMRGMGAGAGTAPAVAAGPSPAAGRGHR